MDDLITPAPPLGSRATVPSLPKHSFTLTRPSEDAVPGIKFAFAPSQLQRLIASRTQEALNAFGGLEGLATGLQTDLKAGINAEEDVIQESVSIEAVAITGAKPNFQHRPISHRGSIADLSPGGFSDRRATYGENRVPKKRPKTFLQLLWLAFNDKLMFLLTASAIVSLALGIYRTVSSTEEGSSIEWVEGLAIIVAVIVIVLATAINDYQKNYKFQTLNAKREERMVKVTRSGTHRSISVFDVLVGDVLHIETGDVVPADGVLIDGFDIQCDESSLTGESEPVTKVVPGKSPQKEGDSFIISGAKVSTGVGHYLVLSIGPMSSYGKIAMSLNDDVEETPLQQKLGVLATYIINFGLTLGAIFFAVLFIRFLVQLKDIEGGANAKGREFLDLFILSITVVVIAVPEGLPLTVTLALAFATTRMLKDKNLVRLMRSCETMGNATTVCSDKTGTLTQNKMTVVAGVLGATKAFGDGALLSNPDNTTALQPLSTSSALMASLSMEVKDLLKASIALNSTATETTDRGVFIGSSTETALLKFGLDNLAWDSLSQERANGSVVQMIPFDAAKKWMAVVVKVDDHRFRLLIKGASEVILAMCTQTLSNPEVDASVSPITERDVSRLKELMSSYAQRSLRVVATAYGDFEEWPPKDVTTRDPRELLRDFTFVSAFGIRDPLRPEVADSVRQCQAAGVSVRMVTGDNFLTAKAIAAECGIYTKGGIAMDRPTFRKLSPAQLSLALPRLQVLARSDPEDKLLLVSHLRKMGEVVAVTGDGTNDTLALKAADVGFSMGISGTEIAREASAIVLMDDNFSSIVKAIGWGRAINDATKKFLQFQFTINATAGLLTIISVFAGGNDASVFSVVQLLWINLIMDTFAALALATDVPTLDLFQRSPEPRSAPIIVTSMWKMIGGQSIYQLAVILTLYFAGMSIFGYHTQEQEDQLQTFTFNTYVLMQFFNQLNSRRSDNYLNIFAGVLRNPWFLFVQAVTLTGQILIVFFGGAAFHTVRLTSAQWGWSVFLGFLTLPLGVLIRLIPDHFLVRTASAIWPSSLVQRWNHRKRLLGPLISRLRRGGSSSDISPASQNSRALAVANRTSSQQGNVSAPASEPFNLVQLVEASKLGSSLSPYGFEVHPDTKKSDPVLVDPNHV